MQAFRTEPQDCLPSASFLCMDFWRSPGHPQSAQRGCGTCVSEWGMGISMWQLHLPYSIACQTFFFFKSDISNTSIITFFFFFFFPHLVSSLQHTSESHWSLTSVPHVKLPAISVCTSPQCTSWKQFSASPNGTRTSCTWTDLYLAGLSSWHPTASKGHPAPKLQQ